MFQNTKFKDDTLKKTLIQLNEFKNNKILKNALKLM